MNFVLRIRPFLVVILTHSFNSFTVTAKFYKEQKQYFNIVVLSNVSLVTYRASEVTTLWHYANLFVIIIIINNIV